MPHRLPIPPSTKPVTTVFRRAIRAKPLVYLICTPRPQKCDRGESRIIYIGTTNACEHRLAASARSIAAA